MKYTLIISLLISLNWSCNQNSSQPSTKEAAAENVSFAHGAYEGNDIQVSETRSTSYATNNTLQPVENKIIKTAHVVVEVKSEKDYHQELKQLMQQNQVRYVQHNRTESDYNIRHFFTLKCNNKKFNSFINAILKQAVYIQTHQIDVQDVTEQFVDLKARLKNKKRTEEQYVAMLQKANSIQDMLLIEKELSRIRENIESLQGQINYIHLKASESTIELEFYENKQMLAKAPGRSFWHKAMDKFTLGWNGFESFILFSINIWPFAIVLAGFWWGVKRWKKNKDIKSTHS